MKDTSLRSLRLGMAKHRHHLKRAWTRPSLEVLGEFISVKEFLKKTKELQVMFNELATATKVPNDLKKELLDIYKFREARFSRQILEASKSVGEMNRNALILLKEIELANSRIVSPEDEKDMLFQIKQCLKRSLEKLRKISITLLVLVRRGRF